MIFFMIAGRGSIALSQNISDEDEKNIVLPLGILF